MIVVGLKFKSDGKIYNFESEEILNKDDKVLVETEKGLQLGIIVNPDIKNNQVKNLKPIISKATDEDYDKYLKNLNLSKKVIDETREIISSMKLNMSLIDASFSLDKKQLLINFISDERVDFRDLVKELASRYHARIELHQIGVRDKAKEIGGLGLCGRELCCSSCVKSINSVNINMVKNQNIALNPAKINGACGRLLCCFNYENDLYEDNRKELPKVGEKVIYKGKQCTVVNLDILNKKYTVRLDDNTYEVVDVK